MDSKVDFEQLLHFSTECRDYVAWQEPDDCIFSCAGRWLVTVVPIIPKGQFLREHLEFFVDKGLATDDVFCRAFLAGIVVLYEGPAPVLDLATKALLQCWENSWIEFVDSKGQPNHLEIGPCVLDQGRLAPAFRVYNDVVNAFSLPLRQHRTGKLLSVRIRPASRDYHCVAVPSRLRAQLTYEKPLDGFRITVKDMFDIESLPTTLGSRAYLELCTPARQTASAVSQLIDRGAQILGFSQLCAMVGVQHPTQCIDFLAPFNPRGDGYQSPSGGSSGQASAIAAYDWLDIAMGSDSTVSGRMPALVNGCFAIRPSDGLISKQGMWSAVPQLDTPCFFSRDLELLQTLIESFCSSCTDYVNADGHCAVVYFPDSLATLPIQQRRIFDVFLKDLESCLQLSAEPVSVTERWDNKPPQEAQGLDLSQFLDAEISNSTYVHLFWQQIKLFWEKYQERFQKQPFMPPPKGIHLWDRALTITLEEHELGFQKINVYRRWLLNEILRTKERNSILLMPIASVKPDYRDECPEYLPKVQLMWEPLLISPILGSPELVVPVGEMSYISRITGREELLPVCVSMMGIPGSDVQLIELARKCLENSGRPTKVLAGHRMFP